MEEEKPIICFNSHSAGTSFICHLKILAIIEMEKWKRRLGQGERDGQRVPLFQEHKGISYPGADRVMLL